GWFKVFHVFAKKYAEDGMYLGYQDEPLENGVVVKEGKSINQILNRMPLMGAKPQIRSTVAHVDTRNDY
ncbi:hypothetical protein, partial [Moritella viscosa]